MRVLVANRGEVAVRVIRAVRASRHECVAVHTPSERNSRHARLASDRYELADEGAGAYLDIDALISAARTTGCTHVHPGWGFLSESAAFAQACADAGLIFVGPEAGILEFFGNKDKARAHARERGVPVLDATDANVDVDTARAFFVDHPGGVMVKAVTGGGGRGMRAVRDIDTLEDAFARCHAEALRSFGCGDLYVEELMSSARHIEVQVIADAERVLCLGERDCTIQRRHQKLIEIAPSPALHDEHRHVLAAYADDVIRDLGYRGLATVEFLVDAPALAHGDLKVAFIEVNPRLQVEHTVTEAVLGLDLVGMQLALADGATLESIGLAGPTPIPRGFAIQCRVNAESVGPDGAVRPSLGTLESLTIPSGPGVRVDTHAETGMSVDGQFDSLLAKVIVHRPAGDFEETAEQARIVLDEWESPGIVSNADLLCHVLEHPVFRSGDFTTSFMEEIIAALPPARQQVSAHPDTTAVASVGGTVVEIAVAVGDAVKTGAPLVVVEAMKMQHVVLAPRPGVVHVLQTQVGDLVYEGTPLVVLLPSEEHEAAAEAEERPELSAIRTDLAEVISRHTQTLDGSRPAAVAKRHDTGHRTTRENLDDLLAEGSFHEYGGLAVAAQRGRRPLAELIEATPADGLVGGTGRVRDQQRSTEVVVAGYDYTVMAGTQGHFGHLKLDRLLELARRRRLPFVLFAEGGGGRPGEVDLEDVRSSWLDTQTFQAMGHLSGLVPTVGVLTGRCFAGNAALLGSCDVIIATEDATVGMGGPAMIEAGGLGSVSPEEVGPMSVQEPNGVVDLVVPDDAAAVDAARRYLSYFGGANTEWRAADQLLLRHALPENRKRAYEVRSVIEVLADEDSVLELRPGFGRSGVTALIRVEGRAYGLIANDPRRLGGAIDSSAADKFARFLQLCDAHGLPIISLCDTPGFMVGPDAERAATVRHVSRLFVIGAHLQVPLTAIILRKAYGLGAQAMAAGSFRHPQATVAWPTGEVGAMGLEGGVRLGFARELERIVEPAERERRFDEFVTAAYEKGKALNAAMMFELDSVIDPAETRSWITATLGRWSPSNRVSRYIDTW